MWHNKSDGAHQWGTFAHWSVKWRYNLSHKRIKNGGNKNDVSGSSRNWKVIPKSESKQDKISNIC